MTYQLPPRVTGTARAFAATLECDASAEALWTVWTDVPGWHRWDLGLRGASLDPGSGPFAAGATGTLLPTRGRPARLAVTACEPGRSYRFEAALPLARLVVERRIESTGPLRFTHAVHFEGPLAAPWSTLLGPGFAKALPPTMRRAAELASTGDGSGADAGATS